MKTGHQPSPAQLYIKMHYTAGVFISVFMALHLANHLVVLFSVDAHHVFQTVVRRIYRNPLVELLLMAAILFQVYSGLRLVIKNWRGKIGRIARWQVYSGLYLSFFMVAHVVAVLYGRYTLQLDTDLAFGAGVMTVMPGLLVYIPYYSVALFSFFIHVATIHHHKMYGLAAPDKLHPQSRWIMRAGVVYTILVIGRMATLSFPLLR